MENLNIKAISEMTGVSAHTLRAWEKRYGAVRPNRISNSRRVYSVEEMERIRSLAFLVKHGHSISHIAKQNDEQLQSLVDMVVRSEQSKIKGASSRDDKPSLNAIPMRIEPSNREELAKFTAHLIALLKEYRLANINVELSQARIRWSAREIVLHVIAPMLREVGLLVDRHDFSIAQEHALSAILRNHLGEMMQVARMQADRSMVNPLTPNVSIVLAMPEGNFHEFGILMSSVLCTAHGIQVHYFGPNLPSQALGEAARAVKPNIILIGNTPVPRANNFIPPGRYLREVDMQLLHRCEFWLGGWWEVNMDLLRTKNPVKRVPRLEDLDAELGKLANLKAQAS